MAEYIDREQLIEHLEYLNNELPLITEHNWGRAKGYDEVIDEIKKYPSADVQPVKHGKNLNEEWPSLFECSICHWSCWDTYCGDTDIYNYFPNCVADMREES